MPSQNPPWLPPRLERVTKLDAARRQLRTAIRLFLEDRDSVSIYTLTAAVQALLRGLLRSAESRHGSFIKDTDWIKPEYYKDYLAIINRPENFFKHADRDADEVLEFHAELVAFNIHDCLSMYAKLTGRMLREGAAFTAWFIMEYPNLLLPGSFAEQMKQVSAETAGIRSRRLYLQLLDRNDLWQDTD